MVTCGDEVTGVGHGKTADEGDDREHDAGGPTMTPARLGTPADTRAVPAVGGQDGAAPTTGAEAFLARHDALLQPRAVVLAHVHGADAEDVFLLTRAAVVETWDSTGSVGDEAGRLRELALLLARTARAVGGDASPATHRPRPVVPPSARAVLTARGLQPAWRHAEASWLLAADETRPLRALAHLDPLSRDLAALRWLDVPPDDVAAELGVEAAELPRRLDTAMARWAVVVESPTASDFGPVP